MTTRTLHTPRPKLGLKSGLGLLALLSSHATLSQETERSQTIDLGAFQIEVSRQAGDLSGRNEDRPYIQVRHSAEPNKILWRTMSSPNLPFIGGYISQPRYSEKHQSIEIFHPAVLPCDRTEIYDQQFDGETLVLKARLRGEVCKIDLTMSFAAQSDQALGFEVSVDDANTIERKKRKTLTESPFIVLSWASPEDERIYGMGAQMSYFDLKGRRVGAVVTEQGIIRETPFWGTLTETLAPGAAGSNVNSYAPSASYITSQSRSVILENLEPSVFDYSVKDRITVESRTRSLRGRILYGKRIPDVLTALTEVTGRMEVLPEWLDNGIVLGTQGGRERVEAQVKLLEEAGAPIAALWLQDWVGKRKEKVMGMEIGSFLWWNWEDDPNQYDDWQGMVKEFEQQGIRTLAYINPFLVDPKKKDHVRRNLFAEAMAEGHFMKKPDGLTPKLAHVITWEAGILDLSQAKTRAWIKQVIKDQMLSTGIHGYMADFGEAWSLTSPPADGSDPVTYHNTYPMVWAQLHREILEELKEEGKDFLFFSRSGFTQSPGIVQLFWLGDQSVVWNHHDGLQSALIGLLNSGLSGQTLNHSDVGGYAALAPAGRALGLVRSKELFMRWVEMNTFSPLFRTHEGNKPKLNHQFDSDAETLAHFSKFARLYTALAPYRRQLMHEAAEFGWPLVRPLAFYHQDLPSINADWRQFYFGADYLVAPVLDKGAQEVLVWMDKGEWRHLWTGEVYRIEEEFGQLFKVQAPMGEPAVFVRVGSEEDKRMQDILPSL